MLMVALPIMVACVKEQEVEMSPKCAILSFSVGNITCSVPTKKYDSNGNATDTVVQRVLAGSDIHFNIDQVNDSIYTVDSLPKWVNLTHVVPTFSSYGNVLRKVADGEYYGITSGSDSIDFSKTVELLCVSTDGTASKSYKVNIYLHTNSTDTLEWKSVASDLKICGLGKALCTDGKVFVFAKNANDENVVACADKGNPAVWNTTTVPVNYGSVVLFKGEFYGIDDDGYIYKSARGQLASQWEKVASDMKVSRLLAADDYYIYAYVQKSETAGVIMSSDNLERWEEQDLDSYEMSMLPETAINSCNYASRTNDKLQTVVLTGLTSNNTQNGVSWYKVSSIDSNTNQEWAYIKVTADNPYGLPLLGDLSVTHYNGSLYAIGKEGGLYKTLYRSDDNGITWHAQKEKYLFPVDLNAANGAVSIVTVGWEMWMIQENGQVWRGTIR